MKDEEQILALEQKVEQLIRDEPDLFLVEVKIKPTNNIKVFIDGDQGINIDRLVRYNRQLYRQLEEENFFPNGDFSLELSSPGLDEPLKLHRQYIKNINRFVELTDTEGQKTEGQLKKVNDEAIEIETIVGKKKEKIIKQIPFQRIKTIKVQIKF
ncbi:MAG: ribosome maturation factor [Chitinophagaceae bacterium]|nr:ribosome maturation factor [Chitinophagaceae bacterium]HQU56626.1 ribosome maturation factor [Chitinophagaceae bacterium]HQV05972.1 ribosome maturation factor [Chitinophagaceae bacterium]